MRRGRHLFSAAAALDAEALWKPRSHVEFFATASLLVGAAIEQHDRSQGMREQLREVQSHCMEARQTPPLADPARVRDPKR